MPRPVKKPLNNSTLDRPATYAAENYKMGQFI